MGASIQAMVLDTGETPQGGTSITRQQSGSSSISTDNLQITAPRFCALDGCRYVASCSIVWCHFYRNVDSNIADWSSTWTQFFFVLSGFVLTHAENARPSRETVSTLFYVRKRLVTILPTYWFYIVLLIARQNISIYHTNQAMCTGAAVLLLHAWLPGCIYIWNLCLWPTWFISALMFFWMILRPLASLLQNLDTRQLLMVLLTCWAWTYFVAFSCALAQADVQREGQPWYWRPWYVQMLVHGPLGYLHTFIAGSAGARLFILSYTECDVGRITQTDPLVLMRIIRRWGMTLGYGVFVLLVLIFRHPWGDVFGNVSFTTMFCHSFLHNGGLLPLHLLIIISACLGADPLAQVFESRVFQFLGSFSYEQYVLQDIVWHILVVSLQRSAWHELLRHRIHQYFLYPVILPLCAYVCHKLVTLVFVDYQRKSPNGIDAKFIRVVDEGIQKLASVWQTRFGNIDRPEPTRPVIRYGRLQTGLCIREGSPDSQIAGTYEETSQPESAPHKEIKRTCFG